MGKTIDPPLPTRLDRHQADTQTLTSSCSQSSALQFSQVASDVPRVKPRLNGDRATLQQPLPSTAQYKYLRLRD